MGGGGGGGGGGGEQCIIVGKDFTLKIYWGPVSNHQLFQCKTSKKILNLGHRKLEVSVKPQICVKKKVIIYSESLKI